MDNKKSFINGFLSKFSWYWGAIIGVAASSLVVFAAVNFIQFNPGESISSSAVNSNFQQIKDKLDDSSLKIVVGMSTSQGVASGTFDINFDLIEDSDAPGSFSASSFTVPAGEQGFYTIYAKTIAAACGSDSLKVEINGGAHSEDLTFICSSPIPLNTGSHTRYLNSGEVIDFKVFSSAGGLTLGTSTVIVIKRDVKI